MIPPAQPDLPDVVIVHGWHGSPPGHWQHWLASSLAASGHRVHFPTLPNPAHPHLPDWLAALDLALQPLSSPPIVVCHSLGTILWLHYLHNHPDTRTRKLVLVAPPSIDAAPPPIQSFFPVPLNPLALHRSSPDALLVCSAADPFCPSGAASTYGAPLRLQTHLLPDEAAHINLDSGFGPWPWLANRIATPIPLVPVAQSALG